MSKSKYIVGVDVGGTFTDVFIINQASGKLATAKVPSTKDDQSRGFVDGILRQISNFSDISTIVHGTTVGTNALLERKGARTGIITTEGFRDVLEMRRRDRPTTWGMRGNFTPVVERTDRLEVAERTLADGIILKPVDGEIVVERARTLLDQGCKAAFNVAVDRRSNSRISGSISVAAVTYALGHTDRTASTARRSLSPLA